MLSINDRNALLSLAKQVVAFSAKQGQKMPLVDVVMNEAMKSEIRATFVTLTIKGQLRGCMGTLDAHEPLVESVRNNAFNAARRDPRFDPVSVEELEVLDYEISILSPPQWIETDTEASLISQLQPGKQGLILEEGAHRATYLPSVWAQLPDPVRFVRELKRKARLPEDYWSDSMKCALYTTESFHS